MGPLLIFFSWKIAHIGQISCFYITLNTFSKLCCTSCYTCRVIVVSLDSKVWRWKKWRKKKRWASILVPNHEHQIATFKSIICFKVFLHCLGNIDTNDLWIWRWSLSSGFSVNLLSSGRIHSLKLVTLDYHLNYIKVVFISIVILDKVIVH